MWGSASDLCGTGRRNPSVVSRGGEHRNDRSGKKERKGLIVQSLEINLLRKSRETAFVESRLDVAVAHGFQIDHGRCDIAVSHPLLQRADIDAVLQVARGVGMAEFVQEPPAAVRAG